MTERAAIDITRERRTIGPAAARLVAGFGIAGVLLLIVSFALEGSGGGAARFHAGWLVAFAFWLSISLGALFFVMLHHLAHATWSVVVRRLAEAMAMNVDLLLVLAIPVVLGASRIYPWTDHAMMTADSALRGKATWLSLPFFGIRLAVCFVVWIVLARLFMRRSTAQDKNGDYRLTRSMEAASAPGMVLFAVTLTVAAFDLLMSLDPRWYSTIFGVYYYAGCVVGFFAAITITTAIVQRSGRLTHAITPEHFHDFGKLIFAFVIFWAYIAFSQYMLTWYGNIPEETSWYLRRQTHGWGSLSLLLLFGHFAVPFFFLLPRFVKRQLAILILPAVWMLLMHAVDIYWLVIPQLDHGTAGPALAPTDVTTFLGIGSLFVAGTIWRLRNVPIIPERDPRLAESLAFENA